jgi:hypothetical protein
MHIQSSVVGFLVISSLSVGLLASAGEEDKLVAGIPSHEALVLGERMYREGILPNGEPMRAFVQRDIEVDGTMFSCVSCHVRSGMGSTEGTVITPPTCGSWLSKPLVGAEMSPRSQARVPDRLDPPPFRPAYTDSSLSRAIRLGKDPNDRVLDWVMPRYALSGDDTDILIHYLNHLSARWSPGVDETTIRFATVIGEGVADVDRRAMLGVLEAHVSDHNSQSRHEERRARGGPFYKEEKYAPYRRYSLSVWELKGDRDTWQQQLEKYYREDPVFALIGGITTGEWAPIHDFCERNQIPALLPVTDFPVVSDSDWYTLYFSKGLFQEGEAAARFLRRTEAIPREAAVVQVYRREPKGRALADGFSTTRSRMRLPAAEDVELAAGVTIDSLFWTRLASEYQETVIVAWLGAEDLSTIDGLVSSKNRPSLVLVSSTMLGESLATLPESARSLTYLTYPGSFAKDEVRSRLATERWLQAKKLPVTNFDIQAKMYFLGWTLAPAVKMMRDDFYRDYFFDIIDMMRDQYYAIAVYPRLSFGPGQRYASKGCYVVQLTGADEPTFEKRSDWVIH